MKKNQVSGEVSHAVAAKFLRDHDRLKVIKENTVAHTIAVSALQAALYRSPTANLAGNNLAGQRSMYEAWVARTSPAIVPCWDPASGNYIGNWSKDTWEAWQAALAHSQDKNEELLSTLRHIADDGMDARQCMEMARLAVSKSQA